MRIFRLMLIVLTALAFVACEPSDQDSSNINNPNKLPNEELNGDPVNGGNNHNNK